ncbi:MAG TPA: isochorismatase family protein [Thermomicrobiales bacterium]|nr:isochorismatase family protein [Thermomicrobiales bacterium]
MSPIETPTFVQDWLKTVPEGTFDSLAPDPSRAAFFSADLINGFVHHGPLASPRVHGIVDDVVRLFTDGWNHGIREFVLLQDTHDPSTPEFNSYPPHALKGDAESETIPELANLPFAQNLTVIEKNSLHPAVETTFNDWWDEHMDLNRAIVVGDCTDLCVYQLAMHLRLRANALNLQDFDVIVPINSVQTFDIPDDPANPGTAHPGDFFHDVFLYHMASNGIRVVTGITTGKDEAR